MDENLAALIGFLISDGSVYYDKSKRTYCIQFTNKNKQMMKNSNSWFPVVSVLRIFISTNVKTLHRCVFSLRKMRDVYLHTLLHSEHFSLKQLHELFKTLEIKSWISSKGVRIDRISEVKKFASLVRFLPESTVVQSTSPNFGKTKNELRTLVYLTLKSSQPNCPPDAVLFRVSNNKPTNWCYTFAYPQPEGCSITAPNYSM